MPLSPLPSCQKCIHNKVCSAFESAILTKKSFDEQFKKVGIKLPMIPENLALDCDNYLIPQAEGFLKNPEGV